MVDKNIIIRIRKGDEKAFRILYESFFYKVVNYSYKLLHSKDDAREVAQDVFIRLWNKRAELDPDQSVVGLIFRITKFFVIDHLRKQDKGIMRVDIASTSELEGSSLETEYLDKELYSVYLDIVDKLPEKRRRIFQMSRDENLSHKEIASKLNISTKTVETQIRLALQQIRQNIKKYSDSLLISLIILFLR